MKKEINFYEVDEGVVKAMGPILLKILDEMKNAFIFIKNLEKIKEIDASLWSYGRSKFIPHVTIFDKDFESEKQPILISNEEKNLNNADYLIFLDEPNQDFLKEFSRSFYFFENSPNCSNIKADNFYKKQQGKWIKILN
jgi:DNA polymerase IIIc chi subunit